MNLDPALLKQITLFAAGFFAAFLAALWLALIFWTARDIRKRSREGFMRVLAVVIVALLFLPGVLVYLILRPQRSLEEEYQRSLEEEALLQSIEDTSLCPGCTRRVQSDWLVCPSCHLTLKKTCTHCDKLIDLSWNLCPYCATPVPGMRLETEVSDSIVDMEFNDESNPSEFTDSDQDFTPYP